MTKHVRTGYRTHRKGTWALVLLVVAAIAAVVIPLATGANSKYYTLTASPTPICSVPTTQTFTLKLANQTRNQNLGSANITAPSYVHLITGTGTSDNGSITVNVPDSFDSTGNTIRVRNMVLSTTNSPATITVQANVDPGSGENWTSIVKQSNTFADSGPGNLFSFQPGFPLPTTTVSQCHYAFVNGTPVNASKNVGQPVNVQLQTSANVKVSVPDNTELDLTAYQGIGSGTQLAPGVFTGLTSTAANGEWGFNVVGTVSGNDYSLKAGTDRSPYFNIADCIPVNGVCSVGFAASGDGLGGGAFNGSGLSSNSGITLSFEAIPASGAAICAAPAPDGWGWSPLTFPPQPPDGKTTFDGITLSTFSLSPKGFMKVTTYLRNDLFVQSSPNQTNDILICAGAAHTDTANHPNGPADQAWMGRNGILSKFDGGAGHTNMYWGVLARIPNCNKAPDFDNNGILDPALCGWGTWTDPNTGILYRTATVLVPYDLDWKNVT